MRMCRFVPIFYGACIIILGESTSKVRSFLQDASSHQFEDIQNCSTNVREFSFRTQLSIYLWNRVCIKSGYLTSAIFKDTTFFFQNLQTFKSAGIKIQTSGIIFQFDTKKNRVIQFCLEQSSGKKFLGSRVQTL